MKARDRKRIEPFRKNLKKLRKSKGLSLRKLAIRCDLEHAQISRLENDPNSNLNITTLFELARGLEVHPKDLIDYDFDFLKEK